MKKLILAIAVCFGVFTEIQAHKVENVTFQAPSSDEKVTKMTALLNLSADQQKKYKALVESSEKDRQALKTKLKTASGDEQEKLKSEFKKDYETKLSQILTPAQLTKLKEEAAKQKK